MDGVWVVLGVLQLALGIVWVALVMADRRRPPDQRRHFKTASLAFPLTAGCVWVLLGLYWLGRGLLG
jgi:hypothetical protein